MDKQYIFNLETTKIELHFEKSEYKVNYNGKWQFSIDGTYANTFVKEC